MRLRMAMFLIGGRSVWPVYARTGRLHGLARLCRWLRVWL